MSKYDDLMKLAKRVEAAKKELHFASQEANTRIPEAVPYLITAAAEANRALQEIDRAIGAEARNNAT